MHNVKKELVLSIGWVIERTRKLINWNVISFSFDSSEHSFMRYKTLLELPRATFGSNPGRIFHHSPVLVLPRMVRVSTQRFSRISRGMD